MNARSRHFLSFVSLATFGLVSCRDAPPAQEITATEETEAMRQVREDIERLESEVEQFREQITKGINQEAVSRMTPEELDAVRSGKIEAPDSVVIPPKE